ncbi:helix-turn-helix domain-containing protein [Nocardiopsis sediminis]|uniref:Helix-turn-helix domain-containing protein n=1 Tax=Nocardiopsis sediminis TaxID=1778267 RepID=A0ABV8FZ02_9ACTN
MGRIQDGSGTDVDAGPGSGSPIDTRAELGAFLRSRRARVSPQEVGLAELGRYRRVPGLRREELARLAGVSVAYLTRLEQGKGRNVSVEVIDAIARALRLTDTEALHLRHLARCTPRKNGRPPAREQVRPAVRDLLAAMEGVPAYVTGRRTDILAWNPMAAALFGDWDRVAPQERNWARLLLLRPGYRRLFAEWDVHAAEAVGALRLYAGCYPDDPRLLALVGELAVKSEEFGRLWAGRDVAGHSHGTRSLHHPLVGEVSLSYESLRLPDDPEHVLVVHHARAGSAAAENLRLLASWGADTSPAHTPAEGP